MRRSLMFLPPKGTSMIRIIDKEKGFSLMEIIVVMILIGIMGTMALMGIIPVVQGMVFTKANAVTTQKGQITITKLIKEFNNINGVMAGANATSVVFTSIKNGSEGERSVIYANNKLYFNNAGAAQGDILTDEVNDFQLHYYKVNSAVDQGSWLVSTRVIEIKLVLLSNDTPVEFTARVRPRNIERR